MKEKNCAPGGHGLSLVKEIRCSGHFVLLFSSFFLSSWPEGQLRMKRKRKIREKMNFFELMSVVSFGHTFLFKQLILGLLKSHQL